MKTKHFLWLALCLPLLWGCRKDPEPVHEEQEQLPAFATATISGLYVLNAGNMSTNKASLDYFEYANGRYHRNIYGEANPAVVRGLGDVGNDLLVYGSKLYVAVTNSNKVEIMDAKTAKRLKVIDLPLARYLTSHNGKVYASAYNSAVKGEPLSPNGVVVEIDTATMAITRTVTAGRQPEELCAVNNRLYVANSGGYTPANYERTVSVIDLVSFTVVRNIDVAENLHHLRKDRYGDLYVNSQGNYNDIPSKLYVIDTQTETVKKSFDIAVGNFCIAGDTAYIVANEYSYQTGKFTVTYSRLDVRTETLLSGNFITDGTDREIQTPSCVAVCPETRAIYVCDALDYTLSGYLYCFNAAGKKLWRVHTGYIPANITFTLKK